MTTEEELQEAIGEKEVLVEDKDLVPVHVQNPPYNMKEVAKIKNDADTIDSAHEGIVNTPEDEVSVEAHSKVKVPSGHNCDDIDSALNGGRIDEAISHEQLEKNDQKNEELVEVLPDERTLPATDEKRKMDEKATTGSLSHGESTSEDKQLSEYEDGKLKEDDIVQQEISKNDHDVEPTFDTQQVQNQESAEATKSTQPEQIVNTQKDGVLVEAPSEVQIPSEHNIVSSDCALSEGGNKEEKVSHEHHKSRDQKDEDEKCENLKPDLSQDAQLVEALPCENTPPATNENNEMDKTAKGDDADHLNHKENLPEDADISKYRNEAINVENQQNVEADVIDAGTEEEEILKSKNDGEQTFDIQKLQNLEPAEEIKDTEVAKTEDTSHECCAASLAEAAPENSGMESENVSTHKECMDYPVELDVSSQKDLQNWGDDIDNSKLECSTCIETVEENLEESTQRSENLDSNLLENVNNDTLSASRTKGEKDLHEDEVNKNSGIPVLESKEEKNKEMQESTGQEEVQVEAKDLGSVHTPNPADLEIKRDAKTDSTTEGSVNPLEDEVFVEAASEVKIPSGPNFHDIDSGWHRERSEEEKISEEPLQKNSQTDEDPVDVPICQSTHPATVNFYDDGEPTSDIQQVKNLESAEVKDTEDVKNDTFKECNVSELEGAAPRNAAMEKDYVNDPLESNVSSEEHLDKMGDGVDNSKLEGTTCIETVEQTIEESTQESENQSSDLAQDITKDSYSTSEGPDEKASHEDAEIHRNTEILPILETKEGRPQNEVEMETNVDKDHIGGLNKETQINILPETIKQEKCKDEISESIGEENTTTDLREKASFAQSFIEDTLEAFGNIEKHGADLIEKDGEHHLAESSSEDTVGVSRNIDQINKEPKADIVEHASSQVSSDWNEEKVTRVQDTGTIGECLHTESSVAQTAQASLEDNPQAAEEVNGTLSSSRTEGEKDLHEDEFNKNSEIIPVLESKEEKHEETQESTRQEEVQVEGEDLGSVHMPNPSDLEIKRDAKLDSATEGPANPPEDEDFVEEASEVKIPSGPNFDGIDSGWHGERSEEKISQERPQKNNQTDEDPVEVPICQRTLPAANENRKMDENSSTDDGNLVMHKESSSQDIDISENRNEVMMVEDQENVKTDIMGANTVQEDILKSELQGEPTSDIQQVKNSESAEVKATRDVRTEDTFKECHVSELKEAAPETASVEKDYINDPMESNVSSDEQMDKSGDGVDNSKSEVSTCIGTVEQTIEESTRESENLSSDLTEHTTKHSFSTLDGPDEKESREDAEVHRNIEILPLLEPKEESPRDEVDMETNVDKDHTGGLNEETQVDVLPEKIKQEKCKDEISESIGEKNTTTDLRQIIRFAQNSSEDTSEASSNIEKNGADLIEKDGENHPAESSCEDTIQASSNIDQINQEPKADNAEHASSQVSSDWHEEKVTRVQGTDITKECLCTERSIAQTAQASLEDNPQAAKDVDEKDYTEQSDKQISDQNAKELPNVALQRQTCENSVDVAEVGQPDETIENAELDQQQTEYEQLKSRDELNQEIEEYRDGNQDIDKENGKSEDKLENFSDEAFGKQLVEDVPIKDVEEKAIPLKQEQHIEATSEVGATPEHIESLGDSEYQPANQDGDDKIPEAVNTSKEASKENVEDITSHHSLSAQRMPDAERPEEELPQTIEKDQVLFQAEEEKSDCKSSDFITELVAKVQSTETKAANIKNPEDNDELKNTTTDLREKESFAQNSNEDTLEASSNIEKNDADLIEKDGEHHPAESFSEDTIEVSSNIDQTNQELKADITEPASSQVSSDCNEEKITHIQDTDTIEECLCTENSITQTTQASLEDNPQAAEDIDEKDYTEQSDKQINDQNVEKHPGMVLQRQPCKKLMDAVEVGQPDETIEKAELDQQQTEYEQLKSQDEQNQEIEESRDGNQYIDKENGKSEDKPENFSDEDSGKPFVEDALVKDVEEKAMPVKQQQHREATSEVGVTQEHIESLGDSKYQPASQDGGDKEISEAVDTSEEASKENVEDSSNQHSLPAQRMPDAEGPKEELPQTTEEKDRVVFPIEEEKSNCRSPDFITEPVVEVQSIETEAANIRNQEENDELKTSESTEMNNDAKTGLTKGMTGAKENMRDITDTPKDENEEVLSPLYKQEICQQSMEEKHENNGEENCTKHHEAEPHFTMEQNLQALTDPAPLEDQILENESGESGVVHKEEVQCRSKIHDDLSLAEEVTQHVEGKQEMYSDHNEKITEEKSMENTINHDNIKKEPKEIEARLSEEQSQGAANNIESTDNSPKEDAITSSGGNVDEETISKQSKGFEEEKEAFKLVAGEVDAQNNKEDAQTRQISLDECTRAPSNQSIVEQDLSIHQKIDNDNLASYEVTSEGQNNCRMNDSQTNDGTLPVKEVKEINGGSSISKGTEDIEEEKNGSSSSERTFGPSYSKESNNECLEENKLQESHKEENLQEELEQAPKIPAETGDNDPAIMDVLANHKKEELDVGIDTQQNIMKDDKPEAANEITSTKKVLETIAQDECNKMSSTDEETPTRGADNQTEDVPEDNSLLVKGKGLRKEAQECSNGKQETGATGDSIQKGIDENEDKKDMSLDHSDESIQISDYTDGIHTQAVKEMYLTDTTEASTIKQLDDLSDISTITEKHSNLNVTEIERKREATEQESLKENEEQVESNDQKGAEEPEKNNELSPNDSTNDSMQLEEPAQKASDKLEEAASSEKMNSNDEILVKDAVVSCPNDGELVSEVETKSKEAKPSKNHESDAKLNKDSCNKASGADAALSEQNLTADNITSRNLDVSSIPTASESFQKKGEETQTSENCDDLISKETVSSQHKTASEHSLSKKTVPTEPAEQVDEKEILAPEEESRHVHDHENLSNEDPKNAEQNELPVSHFLMNLILQEEIGDPSGNSEIKSKSKQKEIIEDNSSISKQEDSSVPYPPEQTMADKFIPEGENQGVKISEEMSDLMEEQTHDSKMGTENSENDNKIQPANPLDSPQISTSEDDVLDKISGVVVGQEKMETTMQIDNGSLHNNADISTDTLQEGRKDGKGYLHDPSQDDKTSDAISSSQKISVAEPASLPHDNEAAGIFLLSKENESFNSSTDEISNLENQPEHTKVENKEENQDQATMEASDSQLGCLQESPQNGITSNVISEEHTFLVTEPTIHREKSLNYDNEPAPIFLHPKEKEAQEAQPEDTEVENKEENQETTNDQTVMEKTNLLEEPKIFDSQKAQKVDNVLGSLERMVKKNEDRVIESHTDMLKNNSSEEPQISNSQSRECDLAVEPPKEDAELEECFVEVIKPIVSIDEKLGGKEDEEIISREKIDDEKDEREGDAKKNVTNDETVTTEARGVDKKLAQKKTHNILSGVGSKVKHSLAKVKKAIIGKSTHTKSVSPK